MSKRVWFKFFALPAIACWFACLVPEAFAGGKDIALILIEKKGKGCAFRVHFPTLNRIDDWFELPGCLSAPEISFSILTRTER